MKRSIVNMMLSIVLIATTIVSSTVSGDKIISNSMTSNSVIDDKQVQYIDEITINRENIQVYDVKTQEDCDRLTPIIENRNGKIVIEISNGIVLNDSGDGVNLCGYYQHYDTKKFLKGDRVRSIFVYNPDTNYPDDILFRMDTLIN